MLQIVLSRILAQHEIVFNMHIFLYFLKLYESKVFYTVTCSVYLSVKGDHHTLNRSTQNVQILARCRAVRLSTQTVCAMLSVTCIQTQF